MSYISENDVFTVYIQLKDRYPVIMTTEASLNEGFTADCPVLVGKAHGDILELYKDGNMFVLDISDEAQTKGTHWHPNDVESAIEDILEFMEDRLEYDLYPFRQQ